MTYAIVCANRVVRGTTTDENARIGSDETLVQVRDTFSAVPIKVIELNGSVREATQAEIRQARLDSEWTANELQRLHDAVNASIDTLASDGTLPANLKDYFVRIKALKDFRE